MEQIDLKLMDASLVSEHFEPGSFDLIVSSLAFSEITPQAQAYVLRQCLRLLATSGKLAILDEVLPAGIQVRLATGVVRLSLRLLAWLLMRTITHPLSNFSATLSRAGFVGVTAASHLGGSMQLIIAQPASEVGEEELPVTVPGCLKHRITVRNILLDLWATFLRILPPYPKVSPGLYAIGRPGSDVPVLVTGNFDLTIRRLARAIDGRLDAWVMAVDSAGINVWCAAGGGFLTAEEIIGALLTNGLEEIVHLRALILPQICANGVDGWVIRRKTGWGMHWGPVRTVDIPDYLVAGRVKMDVMRQVQFPLKDRLEIVTVTLGFYGLLILIPVLIFWRSLLWPVLISMVSPSYY